MPINIDGNIAYTAGTSIISGFYDAVAIARKTRKIVKLRWNGTTTSVSCADTPSGLMRKWHLKREKSTSSRMWKARRRRQELETNQKARRLAATLPDYLFAWALDSDRFYGKALSILIAADALEIARRYGTAEAIKEAFNENTLVTVADSGASRAMTAQMAAQIAEGKFPGQDSNGLITHHYKNGKETFNLWKEVGE